VLVFAVNTFSPWTTAATLQFQIAIDSTGDGVPDFLVLGGDAGSSRRAARTVRGELRAEPQDRRAGPRVRRHGADWRNHHPPAAVAADIGVTQANARFSYSIRSFDRRPRPERR